MKHKVLVVVDDNEQIIDDLCRWLGPQYQLIPISRGSRAKELGGNIGFDLIIVTRWISDSNSVELLSELRSIETKVPILFIGDKVSCDLILNIWRAGANDFLCYPFSNDELQACLKRILHPPNPPSEVQNKKSPPEKRSKHRKGLFDLLHRYQKSTENVDTVSQNKPTASILPEIQKKQHQNAQPDSRTTPVIDVNYFGVFEIRVNERLLTGWQGKKAKLLCAFLFLHNRSLYRDKLMELFWPGSGVLAARNCLNVTVHQIRSCFQEIIPDYPFILFRDECYCVNPEIEVNRDIDVFKMHWRSAKAYDNDRNYKAALFEYELAASVYRGDFMEDELYERWIENERESLKESYLLILDRISYFYSMNGKPDIAVDLCNQILCKDECREDIHRRIMKCYTRIGQPQRALKQFEKCKKVLREELEVKPTRKTIELYEMIKNKLN